MSTKTLRPSPQSFRNAGWLPKSKDAYDQYMKNLSDRISSGVYRSADALLPPVRAFKNFIENDPTVYGEFIRMFDNVTESVSISLFFLCDYQLVTVALSPKTT